MNNFRPIKNLAVLILTGCFLVVTAGLSYTPETHLHLGHHDQQSHGKTWCSWTCQAGHALKGFSLVIPQPLSRLHTTEVSHPVVPELTLFLHSPSRAPPFLA